MLPVQKPQAVSATEVAVDAGAAGFGHQFSVLGLLAGWGIGLLALASLVGLTLHFGDFGLFAAAIRTADPLWLSGAVLFQILTYVCAAATWSRTLARAGVRRPISSLFSLAIVELFVNQAIPTGGLSGSVMVVRGLVRRGVPSSLATTALLLAAVSYYAAYLLAACIAFLLLWRNGDFSESWLAISLVFVVVIGILAALVVVVARSGGSFVPKVLTKWRPAARIAELLKHVRIDILRDAGVLAQALALQSLIFLFDAATLSCAANAVGAGIGFGSAFSSFVLASVVATLAPIPLGLGSFEATCVAMLHMQGSGTEAALAATLILRGFTFWLPMLPGLWLVYRETRKHASVRQGAGG